MTIRRRLAYRLIAACLAGSAMLSAGPAADARPGSPELSVSDTRLAGPGVDISVTIPAGWHQVPVRLPQLMQMAYPATCANPRLGCASAFALIGSGQDVSAQSAAELAERTLAAGPRIRGATVTSEGPTQVAGRTGYFVRFTGSNVAQVKVQGEIVAVQTGPASSGTARISIACAGVSNLVDAPPASVIDQIIDSTQIGRQLQSASQTGLEPALDILPAERPSPRPRMVS